MNFPIISSLILLPLVGSIFILFIKSSENNKSSKNVALFISIANFLLSIYLWIIFDNSLSDFQFVE